MNAVHRWMAQGVDALRRPWLRRRLGKVVVEEVCGLPLVVLPEVFNPRIFRTGELTAEGIAQLPWEGEEPPRVLDLGTGSGVGSVFAALRGWPVVAVDINPQAVRCCRINALLHGVEDRVEGRCGDLWEPVQREAAERFDLLFFNPPYFEGEPDSPLDAAWRSENVLERFARGLKGVLTPGGRALLSLSDHGACGSLLERLREEGFTVEVLLQRDFGNEVLTVYTTGAAP